MAVNMFAKFVGNDIQFSSLMKGYENWSEVITWNHSFHQPTSPVRSASASGTIEQAHHAPFSYTMTMDKGYTALLKALWSGKHFDEWHLVAKNSSGDGSAASTAVPYLKIDMSSVIISDLSVSAGPGDMPMLAISLNYAAITYTYTVADPLKGTTSAALPVKHDITTNEIS
ncbi:MAG: type VI secretion system secreted protein Hcp [Bradymonadia bacterium]|jgi:type VI secretion system secreted protein Hcp